jgi:hypothetical protein
MVSPKLTLLDRHSEEDRRNMVAACAIMHVVIEIRNDEGDRKQGSEVSRKTRKGLVAGAGHIGEIHPRVVLARVSAGSADSGSG